MKNKKYKSLTDEEIKQIADDIYKGYIFTDRHIRNPDDVHMVFIPLIFINEESFEEIKKDLPGMIYEYMSKASPRAINGMPIFMSMNMVSKEDTKKILDKYNQIKSIIASI